MHNEKDKNLKNWYKLDNAAKIYPAVRNKKWSGNFRVSITLNEEVDPAILQQALNDMRERIINLNLELKKGFFWYFFEESERIVLVEPDSHDPCGRIGGKQNRDMPYRLRYYHNRISLEIFHALADGTGGMILLKSIVARYIEIKHHIEIPQTSDIISVRSDFDPEEMEDAFKRYAKFRTLKSRKELRGYHFRSPKLSDDRISLITGIISFKEIHEQSKKYNITVTEFIVSLMIESFMKCQEKSSARVERPVKVSVPINLRKIYPSKTLRNFALYINPGIEPRYGEFTFKEITEEVHHFMRVNNKEKYLNAIMCKNLSDEMNPMVRAIPLGIKNIAMKTAFHLYGEALVSSTFSNLGKVTLPTEMEQYVERFQFMLGRFMEGMPSAAATSYKENMYITWTSGKKNKDVEKYFFTSLIKMGIHVKIESNC